MILTKEFEFQNARKVQLTFDLNNSLNDIEIQETNDKKSCFICKKGNRSYIYDEFIIFSGPKVEVKSSISFYKSSSTGKYTPRIIFYKQKKDGEIKETQNEKIRIEFNDSERGLNNFWKLMSFLFNYKDLVDTGDFNGEYKIVSTGAYISEFKTKEEYEKVEDLKRIFKESDIDEKTIKEAISDTRKKVIDQFKELLSNDDYSQYRQDNQITQTGDEIVWHHFLKNNDWLLGLNVDIKFIRDFIDETSIGNPNSIGIGNPRNDIMGVSDYTTLIEIKTPKTHFFTLEKSSKARTGTWSFTQDFIEGISQCLKQKIDWEKNQKNKDLVFNGEIIDQDIHRTIDPKVIFIMGNKQSELDLNSKNVDILTKRDTLERFKRNNRNIEIISYDELYERAYFIVYHKPAPILNMNHETKVDDFPF